MTPILYRGKPTEDEDWVYGYYVENLISFESFPTFSPDPGIYRFYSRQCVPKSGYRQ